MLVSKDAGAREHHEGQDSSTDADLLRTVFERDYRRLCAFAAFLITDRDRAEELVMDAFARTFARRRGFPDARAASAYVQRAVLNTARTALRRRTVEGRANWAHHRRDRANPGVVPMERDGRLWAAILALPTRQREAVMLRYYDDLPDAEVARLLGCAVGTVKSQLAKARANLARSLATREDLDDD